jgi:hypothetical protein
MWASLRMRRQRQRQQRVRGFCAWKDAVAAEAEHCDCTRAVYEKAATMPLEVLAQALLAETVAIMPMQPA